MCSNENRYSNLKKQKNRQNSTKTAMKDVLFSKLEGPNNFFWRRGVCPLKSLLLQYLTTSDNLISMQF